MKIRSLILLVALGISPLARAQDNAPTDVDPKNYAVAQDIVKSFDMGALLHGVLQAMTQTMIPLINQSNPGQGDRIEKIVAAAVEKNLDAHLDAINRNKAEIYAQIFTYDELTQLRDFYRSPIGQKMIKKTPDMMKRSAALDQGIMLSAIHDTNRDVIDALRKGGMTIPKGMGV